MKKIINDGVTIFKEDGFTEFSKRAFSHIYVKRIKNHIWNARYSSGTSILEKDWDNLLLLDACRYDYFCQIPQHKKIVDKRITLESQTPDFLSSTFNNPPYHDIVYVTANPQTLKFQYELDRDDYIFHKIISVLDEWDKETQTIKPNKLRQAAIKAANKYPNKKILIHFLQPHAPFLGDTAESIRRRTGKTIEGMNPGNREYIYMNQKDIQTTSYQEILKEDIKPDEIRSAYLETLKIAVNECHSLQESLQGKTVLTSDHGELLGERLSPIGPRRWGHPGNVRTKELCVVPYVDFDYSCRKEIKPEPPVKNTTIDGEAVNKRLRSLGYM